MKNNNSKGKSNKLFNLLKIINEDELYKLKRFINSDYFNTNNRLKTLFEAILNARIEVSNFQHIDPEQLHKTVFPDKNSGTAADDFSGLLKLVKGFLAQESYNLDDNAKTRFFINTLLSKQAISQTKLILNQESKKYEQSEKSRQTQSIHNYYHNIWIAEMKLNYYIIENRKALKPNYFSDYDDCIDRFYAGLKAKNQLLLEQMAKDNGIDFEIKHKDFLSSLVPTFSEASNPLIKQYTEAYELSKDFNFDRLDKIVRIFDNYGKRFDVTEELLFCQMMFNICATFGKTKQQNDLLNYKYIFLNRLIKNEAAFYIPNSKKNIRSTTYLNYMRVLIMLGKFDEFQLDKRKFEKKVRFTSTDEEDVFKSYLMISLNLEKFLTIISTDRNKSDFYLKQASYLLEKHEAKIARGDLSYTIATFRTVFEVLGVKIAYHRKTQFLKRRSAMQKYLSGSKKLMEHKKEFFINFCNIVLKIYKLRESKKPTLEQIEELRKLINEKDNINEKNWLGYCLTEIEKTIS